MGGNTDLLVFVLAGRRFALRVLDVVRVLHSVEITPLPQAPAVVAGVIDMEGTLLPVVDMRLRFGLASRKVSLKDRMILARSPRRLVGLLVDGTEGLVEVSEERCVPSETLLHGLDMVQGVLQLEDGLVLIHDIERCLSLDEERALSEALGAAE